MVKKVKKTPIEVTGKTEKANVEDKVIPTPKPHAKDLPDPVTGVKTSTIPISKELKYQSFASTSYEEDSPKNQQVQN